MIRTLSALLLLCLLATPLHAVEGLKNLLIGHWTYGGDGCDSGTPIAFKADGTASDQTFEAKWTATGNEVHFKGLSYSGDLPRDPDEKGEPFETIWKVMTIDRQHMTVRLAGGETTQFTRC